MGKDNEEEEEFSALVLEELHLNSLESVSDEVLSDEDEEEGADKNKDSDDKDGNDDTSKVSSKDKDDEDDKSKSKKDKENISKPDENDKGGENEDDDDESKISKSGDGKSNDDDDEVEYDFSVLYETLLDELEIDIKIEDLKDLEIDITKPEDIASFIKKVIKDSSTPEFASDDSRDYNKFIENGGDGKAYFQVKYGNPLDYSKLDPEDLTDEVKEKVVRENLTLQFPKKDSKFIEGKLKRVKEAGILDEEAKDALDVLAEKQENDNKTLEESVKKTKQKAIDDSNTFQENLKKSINEVDNIANIPINKLGKKKFYDFLTAPSKRSGLTAYAQALKDDPQAQVKMAYFLHLNFDFKDIEMKAETANAKKVRKGLEGYEKKIKGKNLKSKNTDSNKEDDAVDFDLLSLDNMI